MIAFAPWQVLLDGLGWVLAWVYDLIPNYGVTIIVLTVVIRLVLLPLGIKQIRSMQHLQAVQPRLKAIQQKYKGNREKQQEETMKLYREHGVHPLSGCWPVLLQFPILIAMYSVLRWPQHPPHLPAGSDLRVQIQQQIPPEGVPDEASSAAGTDFLGMNLLCSAIQAGDAEAKLGDRVSVEGETVDRSYPVDCGSGVPVRIPYYAFVALMFGTTFYQQRQMQKATPPGASSAQQQAILKLMPLMFGVFGIFFPVGLVVYWTTSNVWQIGQQYFMLKRRPSAEQLAAAAADGRGKGRKGFLSSVMERANEKREQRQGSVKKPPRRPGAGRGKPGAKRQDQRRKPGSGGTSATRNRKKRPKR